MDHSRVSIFRGSLTPKVFVTVPYSDVEKYLNCHASRSHSKMVAYSGTAFEKLVEQKTNGLQKTPIVILLNSIFHIGIRVFAPFRGEV